jgi:thiosulfate/3-mercaptopyruvate sulfurtransferase
MLKSVGHQKVQVLNGGLLAAKKHNFPLSSKTDVPQKASTPYITDKWHLATIEMAEIESRSKNSDFLIVDVRESARYEGKTEPIDPVAGHIPAAINIPFSENLDENGFFLKPEVLKIKYSAYFAKFKPENIAIHCGSGVTACHSLVAMDYAGMELPNLYVGSWSEWCRNGKEIGKS